VKAHKGAVGVSGVEIDDITVCPESELAFLDEDERESAIVETSTFRMLAADLA